MMEYYETKRMLVRNLIIGAVMGVVIGGVFAFVLASPTVDGGYLNYLVNQGYTQEDATLATTVAAALLFVLSFLWALFLPLGYRLLKRVRDRLLDGWIVSCLLLIIIQVIIFAVALSFGSILGFGYLVYCLFRMTHLKKRAKKNEGR